MRNSELIEDKINRLSEDLERLTLEYETTTNEIRGEINKLRSEVRSIKRGKTNQEINSNQKTEIESTGFRKGQQVVITNHYKNNRGITGIITKVTNKRVTLRDSTGEYHVRGYNNIKVIKP
jgi:hypothetical protein